MANTAKIQKVTERGQITLPVEWRRRHDARNIIVKEIGGKLEIAPLKDLESNEYTVFDAIRDNKGRGIKAGDLVKILKRIVRDE